MRKQYATSQSKYCVWIWNRRYLIAVEQLPVSELHGVHVYGNFVGTCQVLKHIQSHSGSIADNRESLRSQKAVDFSLSLPRLGTGAQRELLKLWVLKGVTFSARIAELGCKYSQSVIILCQNPYNVLFILGYQNSSMAKELGSRSKGPVSSPNLQEIIFYKNWYSGLKT